MEARWSASNDEIRRLYARRFKNVQQSREKSYLVPLRVEESLSSPASRTSSTGDEMHGGAAGTLAASPDGQLQ